MIVNNFDNHAARIEELLNVSCLLEFCQADCNWDIRVVLGQSEEPFRKFALVNWQLKDTRLEVDSFFELLDHRQNSEPEIK